MNLELQELFFELDDAINAYEFVMETHPNMENLSEDLLDKISWLATDAKEALNDLKDYLREYCNEIVD